LEAFPDDEEIRSSLVGDFLTGSWTGPESAQVSTQIAQLRGWLASEAESPEVKRWARSLIDALEGHLVQVREREAEEGR
jgi:hypothetical protein